MTYPLAAPRALTLCVLGLFASPAAAQPAPPSAETDAATAPPPALAAESTATEAADDSPAVEAVSSKTSETGDDPVLETASPNEQETTGVPPANSNSPSGDGPTADASPHGHAPADSPDENPDAELPPQDYLSRSQHTPPSPDKARQWEMRPGVPSDEYFLYVPRAILFVPKLVLTVVFLPVEGAALAADRYQVIEHTEDFLYNDARTAAILPVVAAQSGYGLSAGARVFHDDLFGNQEHLELGGRYGGEFSQSYWLAFAADRLARSPLWLEAEGQFDARPRLLFYGIGNRDVESPTAAGQAGRDIAVATRFREERILGAITVGASIKRPNWRSRIGLTGIFNHREFGDEVLAGDEVSIEQIYDTSSLTGFDDGADILDIGPRFVFDSRELSGRPTEGVYLDLFASRAVGLNSPFDRYTALLESFLTRRSTRAMELRRSVPAHNTNALDEVPDSSWFTNRIGVRDISPAEAALGASQAGPPVLPITVTGGKPGGRNPGLMAKDASGRVFVVKFDTKENPELQTSTNTILNRLFWTLGYNVPNDTIFFFKRADVLLGPGARVKDALGNKRSMTDQDVSDILFAAPRSADRSYRATASEFIGGAPKGGWLREGTRDDDPNDVIPHEHRRELRGLRVFASWVNHSDMKQDNSHDSYVDENGKQFLKHYLLDFGGPPATPGRPPTGFEHLFDWSVHTRAFLSLGLWVRPWETIEEMPWPSVGTFSAKNFDPLTWRGMFPYWPYSELDEADAYWAAKLIMRFDRPMLKALVAEGQLSEPNAASYVVETLYERRRIIGKVFLEAVTPLDHFQISERELCMVDLSVKHGLVSSGLVEVLDEQDQVVFDNLVDRRGRLCIPIPATDDYSVYRLRVRRRGKSKPIMQVHFKGGPRARLLGIVRHER